MNLPKLKRVLTDPDEFISNGQFKSLVLEVLELVPMEGIEGLMIKETFESQGISHTSLLQS